MTVSTQYQPFTFKPGAAMTAEAIPWQFLAGEQIVVTHIAAVTAAETVLVLGDDYSISGSGPDGTGSVTALAAWPVNDDFRVERATSLEQEYELPPFEAIRSSALERENDRQLMALQEQVSTLTRAVLAPVGQDAPKLDIAGLIEGDILEYRGGRIRRLLREAFAGKFFAGDATGKMVPASGTGADSALRVDIAASVGSALVGRNRVLGTFENTTVETALNATVINVFENFTPAQISAVRACSAVTFLAEAMQEVFDWAGSRGAVVDIPYGGYDLRSPLVKPARMYLRAECPSFPDPTYDPGLSRTVGVVFAKKHNGDCITVDGSSAYAVCGGIRGICISSNKITYPTGRGLVVNRVGSYRIDELRVFSVGGDALVLGEAAGEETGQIHANGIYINNPGGACIRNRSKWLKMQQTETDGGTYSYISQDASNADISQFHFEGAINKAIMLGGANGNSRFRGGFLGLTNLAATHGVDIANVAGNSDVLLQAIQMQMQATMIGVEVGGAAWRTTIDTCEINAASKGVINRGRNVNIIGNKFLTNGLPIEERGTGTTIRGNTEVATTGSWSIDHTADCGDNGIWEANQLEKPIKPTKFGGASGNFGSNLVTRNRGFKTAAKGVTGAMTTGTVIPHGMSVTPHVVSVDVVDPFVRPADLRIGYNATNITLTWSGGTSIQFSWQAFAVCEGV